MIRTSTDAGSVGFFLRGDSGSRLQDVVRDQRLARGIERIRVREQLVEHDAEREQVAPVIERDRC